MQKVDSEVRRIIDQQYALARKLIEDNQDKMHAMAKALLEWETIDSDQIDDIMAGREPVLPRTGRPGSAQQRWWQRRSTCRSGRPRTQRGLIR